MFGTKCPSITSRWIQSAPAASTARISSPSLEKSAAKIDGAMTRGRDANGWDIGASRCSLGDAEWHPRNMRDARGQCARHEGLWAGKICRERHQLPGRWVRVAQEAQQNMGFCDGTALAQEPARVSRAADAAAQVGVLPCCLPLA